MSTPNLKLVRIPRELADAAKALGRAAGVSSSRVLVMAIQQGLPIAKAKLAAINTP
jgi:hypothetical protein